MKPSREEKFKFWLNLKPIYSSLGENGGNFYSILVDEEEVDEDYNEEDVFSDDESPKIVVKRPTRFRFAALQHPDEFEALWERVKRVPLNLEPLSSTVTDVLLFLYYCTLF